MRLKSRGRSCIEVVLGEGVRAGARNAWVLYKGSLQGALILFSFRILSSLSFFSFRQSFGFRVFSSSWWECQATLAGVGAPQLVLTLAWPSVVAAASFAASWSRFLPLGPVCAASFPRSCAAAGFPEAEMAAR